MKNLSVSCSIEDWRGLFDALPDPTFILDQEYKILRLNQAASELIGTPQEKAVGQPCYKLIHGTESPPPNCPHQQALTTGLRVVTEVEEPNLKGSFEVSATPLTGEGNNITSTIHVMKDITQKKRYEETLRLSEEKFAKIYKASPAWIILSTKDEGRYIEVNDAYLKDIGYSREEVIGKTSLELNLWTNPEDRSKLITEITEKSSLRNFSATGRSKSGELIYGLLSSELIRLNGKDCILTVGLNISDLKKAEDSLKASEERYRTLVESTSDAIIQLDTKRQIVSCNQALCKLFGYDKNELEGSSIRILHSSEDSFNNIGKLIYPTIKQEGFWRGEWTLAKKDGTPIPVEIVISIIRSPEGETSGYVGIIRDLTEQKKAEKEKADLQSQLLQAQKMEAIGTLAGGVAHDFNNLLTIIQGNCELSLMLAKDEDLKKSIEEIKQAAQRGADLTHQLLAFSRKQLLEPKILDLNAIIKNMEKMLHRIIGEDIQLITRLQKDTGKIKADPGQINQVILNLATNARDAMPKGGKLIIETSNTYLTQEYANEHVGVTPGPYVLLSITDTGSGIPPEIKERIFEPFFTTKAVGKGTGLGLSTVYGIVKQSGGNIWVYSEPGQGTTFKIYLPKVDLPPDQLKEKNLTDIPKGSETILLIEDDNHVRDVTKKMLTTLGYQVIEAQDGTKAIQIAKERKASIDLILTDVVMPHMNGKEVAEQIQESHPEAKVLYMSGYTDATISHYGVLDKGVNYLQKPFSFEEFARKVRESLDNHL